jgi:hypothetical protein
MTFFQDDAVGEGERRNLAFQVVNALRETVSIAARSPSQVTYEQTLDLINDLYPELYQDFVALLSNRNESETVKFYKEKAEALSTAERVINPLDLVEKDVAEMQKLLERGNKFALKRKLIELLAAAKQFRPREVSEHKILNHDFYLAERGGYFGKTLYENDQYKDYKLSDNRVLRLRLLHPDHGETITGTDLIYEVFDLLNERVRFAHLQYKVWNNGELYLNDARMGKQLEKIGNNLCLANYCNGYKDETDRPYRMPYCSGFLRPTDKVLDSSSKLKSTGIHVPICAVNALRKTATKLTKANSSDRAVSHHIFEDMFNSNLLGSRWIPMDELDVVYKRKGLDSLTENIRVHAQEVKLIFDEEKMKNLGRD